MTKIEQRILITSAGAKRQARSALDVLLAFFKLGITCFGGPIAHALPPWERVRSAFGRISTNV